MNIVRDDFTAWMYEDKRNYFLKRAIAIVGDPDDAEDALQDAFFDSLHANGSAKPVDVLLQARCEAIVDDRKKGVKYIAQIPSTAKLPQDFRPDSMPEENSDLSDLV